MSAKNLDPSVHIFNNLQNFLFRPQQTQTTPRIAAPQIAQVLSHPRPCGIAPSRTTVIVIISIIAIITIYLFTLSFLKRLSIYHQQTQTWRKEGGGKLRLVH